MALGLRAAGHVGSISGSQHTDDVAQGKKWANGAVYFRLIPTVLIWAIFPFIPQHPRSLGVPFLMVIAVYLTAGIWLVGGTPRRQMSLARQAYLLFSYFVILMGSFSLAYWNYGRTPYFNTSLTRLDAVYFTIGTLSTAGTGNIVATSELTRAVQGIQMAIDLGLVLFSVAVVIARYVSSRGGSNSPPFSQ